MGSVVKSNNAQADASSSSEARIEMSHRAAKPRFVRRNIPLLQETAHLPKFFRNFLQDSLEWRGRLGDVFCRRLGAPSVYLCHPDLVRHVLRTNVRNYVKGPDYQRLRPLLGNGIIVSEGELWSGQRRLLAPEFREREAVRFLPLFHAELDRLGHRWRPAIAGGEPIDVGAGLHEFALRVLGGALFQSDFDHVANRIAESIETILSQATLQMISMGLLASWLPTPGNRRAHEAERWLNSVVLDLIHKGHGSHSHGDCPIAVSGVDMVSRMLVAEDPETGARMSEQQLIDEVKNLILAGHETTAIAMTWTLYLLARHPEINARVVAEVDATCARQPVRIEHIEKLVYVRQVLLETMRLYPPVPAVTRTALADDAFDGIVVRAGESVTMQGYIIHRHPEYWPEPERFDPDRFAPERIDGIEPYSYLAFLRGRRACLGEHFAMLEAITAIARLLSQFEFELARDDQIGIRPISTLRLDRPLSMRVRSRAS
jgi:cytochrome P450